MVLVSSSYFLLTSNHHPIHLTQQKGLGVTPDIIVEEHWEISFANLPFQRGQK